MAKDKKNKNSVPSYVITEATLRQLLTDDMKENSSELAWAKENGITPQSISAFRRKVAGPGLKIPELVGYRPQTVYIPLDAELISTPAAPRRATDNPTSKVDHTKPPIEAKASTSETEKEAKKKKKKLLKKKAKGK